MTPERKEIIRAKAFVILLVINSIVGVVMLSYGLYQKTLRKQGNEAFAVQILENEKQLEIVMKELEACRQK